MKDYSITFLGKNFSDNTTLNYSIVDLPNALTSTIYVNNTTHTLAYDNATGIFSISSGTLPTDNILYFSGSLNNTDILNGWGSFFRYSAYIVPITGLTFYILKAKIIKVNCFVAQPSDMDESIELRYWGSGLKKISRCRLQIKLKIEYFKNAGYFNDYQGYAKFLILKDVLRSNYKQILAMGNGFDRWVGTSEPDTQTIPITALNLTNLQLLYPSLVFPLKIEVFDYGELETIANKNKDSSSLTLVSPELFQFN